MVPRPPFHQPLSRLATWSGRLALFALAVAGLSVVVVRSDLLEVGPALAAFAAALALAGLAVLLAFAAFVRIWQHGHAGFGRALGGFVLGCALLVYPAYLGYRAISLPALTDITSDAADPPPFVALAGQRPPNRRAYPGPAAAARQKTAYPDLVPLEEDIAPQEAYRIVLGLVIRRKWQVVDAHPPGGARRDGTVEAIARSPIMGLRDDVVIRIRPAAGGTTIDMRSASRFGPHDFGANAARIRSLFDDIDDAVGNLPPESAAPEKKPPAKRPTPRTPPR